MKHNPDVKTDWTKKEMSLIAAQIDKYHRVAQGEPSPEVFDEHSDDCLICDAVGKSYSEVWPDGISDCGSCPLSDGSKFKSKSNAPCAYGEHFIDQDDRHFITSKQARDRRDYLVNRIHESGAGITIYFE